MKKKKEKVIFITNQFKTGGVETMFLNIVKILGKQVFLYPIHYKLDKHLINKLPQNVTMMKNKYSMSRNLYGIIITIFLALIQKKKIQKKYQIKAVNFSDTLTTLIISYIMNPKNCISWIHCNPHALLNSKSHKIYWYFLKRCQKIVFISETQRKLFMKMPESKDISLSNTIVCTNFFDKNEVTDKKNVHLAIKKNYFFTAARLDLRSKDYKTLILGYNLLSNSIKKKYTLMIAGDGPDKGKIVSLIHDLGLDDNIRLIGNQSNVYNYMKNSKLYIHSSISEGFSMAILEALGCGCTVVSSNCNVGPKEILNNGQYGYLYKPGDYNELAAQISRALECPIRENQAIQRANYITDKGIKQVRSFFNE